VLDPDAESRIRQDEKDRKVDRINRGLQRDKDLNDVHPATPDRPMIKLGPGVDSQADINALESWAKEHPVKLTGARLVGNKRSLESIRNIHGKH
jgi:hypothetical protein